MRRQLVLMTLGVTSIVVIAFVLPLALLVRTIAADRAVSHANADAQYIGQLIAANQRASPALVAQANASSHGQISAYFSDGVVVGDRSRPPAVDSLRLARQGRTFRRSWSGGVDVFLPVLETGGQTVVVRVSVANHELLRGVRTAWWSLAALGLALIGVAVLVADRMARSITRPMQTLTDIARRLAGGDLDARSRVSGSAEVVEVSRALDALASRIGDLLSAEREHAADLSHSLRTPLTALRLDAELLHDKSEAKRITDAVDDLEIAVTNVIADTRHERSHARQDAVDLGEVVRSRLAFWVVLTHAQQRALDVRLHSDPLPVGASRRDVEAVIDVLIENVLRHTAAGCTVRVTTEARLSAGHLIVEDAGFGLSTNDCGTARGSGRGLEIARRITRASSGSVALSRSDLGGARIDVEFGAPGS